MLFEYMADSSDISHGIVIVILNVIVVPPIIVMAIKRGESPQVALSCSSVDGFQPIKSGPLLLLRRARFQLRLPSQY